MSATLRYRGDKSKILEIAKNLDAFKRVPEKYTETTEIGGTLSLMSRLFIIFLIYKEISYYCNETDIRYEFRPDVDMDEEVPMHIDMTLKTPCNSLTDDRIDETHVDDYLGALKRESVPWQMSPTDQANFESIQIVNTYLREQYHSLAKLLFKDIMHAEDPDGEQRKTFVQMVEEQQPLLDACRIHGTVRLKKVAGVLYLLGGHQTQYLMFGGGITILHSRSAANLSHRINRLSFGRYAKRIVQPLEGDEIITTDNNTSVYYFLSIVPTAIYNQFSTINTYQYAVKMHKRPPRDNALDRYETGISLHYDWSALKIHVHSHREQLGQLLIRLCAMIAGISVSSRILNTLLIAVQDKLRRNKDRSEHELALVTPLITPLPGTSALVSSMIIEPKTVLKSLADVDVIVP